MVERWRQAYNRIRPHSALGYRLPAPEAVAPRGERLTLFLYNQGAGQKPLNALESNAFPLYSCDDIGGGVPHWVGKYHTRVLLAGELNILYV